MSAAGSQCTIQLKTGEFCGGQAMPDAPFPICGRHVREVFQFAADFIAGSDTAEVFERYRQIPSGKAEWLGEPTKAPAKTPAVYYLRVDTLIKIGYTENVDQRMRHYPPNAELLAVEYSPDAWKVEKLRHRQFAHLRADRDEWFRPELGLLNFIASIRPAA